MLAAQVIRAWTASLAPDVSIVAQVRSAFVCWGTGWLRCRLLLATLRRQVLVVVLLEDLAVVLVVVEVVEVGMVM